MVGVEGFMGLRVTVIVDEDGVVALSLAVGLGFGRCGWGGCGRRGSVYWRDGQSLVVEQIDMRVVEEGLGRLTAPCAGYCRASAM
jgi:hypothetical protein